MSTSTTDASSSGKYTPEWLKDTADRVVSTGAQSAIATLTAGATGLLDVDWITIGSVTGLAMLLAALKALAIAQRTS